MNNENKSKPKSFGPPQIGGATVVVKFLTTDQGLTLSASQIVLT